MALSALIHKNKTVPVATQDTETPATVAKVATVTVANPTESKNPELLVTVWTPAGNPMQVQARNTEHTAFLLRMNPKPAHPLSDPDLGGKHG